MRDVLIASVVLFGLICTVRKPYAGVLLWSWLSYMNPHRLAYGFAFGAPFAQITAITLIISMLANKDSRKIPVNALIIIWIIFIIYMGITTANAYYPIEAKTYYIRVLKIQFIVFLTIKLITDLKKLDELLWVIVISIGYFGVKGGIFTLLTGGSHIVFGPPGSFIEDNNELAVAVLMIIPMMIYLYHIQEKLWIKRALQIAMVCSLFTILGTQSRGALLAILAVGFFYWSKSPNKLMSGLIIVIVGLVIFSFMPESWYKRMDTIQEYQSDGSAMGRINAWYYAFNAANDNFLGMGFNSWSLQTFAIYAPEPTSVHVAHSIYFSVLGDHGWGGLVLFLIIYLLTWLKLVKVIKATNSTPELENYNFLAKMLQVSLIAYFVGGAFLSLSYFDLPWHIISFVVLIDEFVKQKKQLQPTLA